jgi:hypothetical protein
MATKWYITSRTVRVTERGRASTSYWQARKVAEATGTTRKATEAEIANRRRDPNRTAPYQVLVMKGRVVR